MSLEELEEHHTQNIICDFLTALVNLHFINGWEYYTSGVLRHQPISIEPYIEDNHPGAQCVTDDISRSFLLKSDKCL